MSFYIFHRHRVCLVDCVDLICSLYSWWEGFGSSSLATLPLGFNCGFISTSACGSSTGVCSWGCPGGLGSAPVRARCGGGAAAWVSGFLAGPGTQVSWRLGYRKYSALERYHNLYWPIHSSILAWRNHLTESWQATVHRAAKSWTWLKWPCVHRCKTSFACGSSVPLRVKHEGGTATWLVGTLVAPSVQGHRLPLPQELWPYQSFFQLLVTGDQKASLASFSP